METKEEGKRGAWLELNPGKGEEKSLLKCLIAYIFFCISIPESVIRHLRYLAIKYHVK